MSPGSIASSARVALVEDDGDLRETLKAILRAAGDTPEASESGTAFLEADDRSAFDVVLTDF